MAEPDLQNTDPQNMATTFAGAPEGATSGDGTQGSDLTQSVEMQARALIAGGDFQAALAILPANSPLRIEAQTSLDKLVNMDGGPTSEQGSSAAPQSQTSEIVIDTPPPAEAAAPTSGLSAQAEFNRELAKTAADASFEVALKKGPAAGLAVASEVYLAKQFGTSTETSLEAFDANTGTPGEIKDLEIGAGVIAPEHKKAPSFESLIGAAGGFGALWDMTSTIDFGTGKAGALGTLPPATEQSAPVEQDAAPALPARK